MDISGHGKHAKSDKGEASPKPEPTTPRPDGATAQTQVNLVSPFAHPRGAKDARVDLRKPAQGRTLPVALMCVALVGGAIAAIIMARRRRNAWEGRIGHLRRAFLDAAKGAG
jgi:hypothetical protein